MMLVWRCNFVHSLCLHADTECAPITVIGPSNIAAIQGEMVTLSCQSTVNQSLLWEKLYLRSYAKGLLNNGTMHRINNNASFSQLVINSVQIKDAGAYFCTGVVTGEEMVTHLTILSKIKQLLARPM